MTWKRSEEPSDLMRATTSTLNRERIRRSGPSLALAAIAAIGLAVLGCSTPTGSSDGSGGTAGTAAGTVFMWIGSDKDSYVSCGQEGPPCPEEQHNFGTHGFLVVARNGVALKKSYVHFGLPILPDGSVVEEAYLELFHPGRNEDGRTDDIRIPVGLAADAWSPLTLNYANQPNAGLQGVQFTIKLNSQDWSGSPDIVDLIRDWYADPSSNRGFHIYWSDAALGVEKGFYSNNDTRRTADDLGLSPRLLLKVQLPDGRTSADIRLPPLPAENDLPFDGQEVLMVRVSGGGDWPESWNVRRGT